MISGERFQMIHDSSCIMRFNPCHARFAYIRFQANFKPNIIPLKLIKYVEGKYPVIKIFYL